MKNIVLSAVAVLAMSSFAVAGGDIAPVEEPVVVPEPVVTDGGLYLGLGYGFNNISLENEYFNDTVSITQTVLDEDYSSIMLQAGYKFNSYVAVEARYWFGLDSDVGLFWGDDNIPADMNLNTFGIYVKPMYPVTDAFDIYALLGYASNDLTTDYNNAADTVDWGSIDGFSWGIGAAYSFSDSLEVFIDYVSLYSDTTDGVYYPGVNLAQEFDGDITSINFGLTYKF